MKNKLLAPDDKKLKDYIVAVVKFKDMSPSAVSSALDKYKKELPKRTEAAVFRFLIESNMKTAMQIAARYRGTGISFASLIREANAALFESVARWKEKGFSNDEFYSYITWKIEGRLINTVLNKNRETGVR
ncbi:MAG TPA: hypothetical protein ENN43_08560 [bacterium]|nr:hypothetical protein [bacterium]